MSDERISDLTIVIQAGGESRRMGTSKALVPFLGKPLIMRSIERLFPICEQMVVTTNEPQRLDFLQPYVKTGRMRLVSDDAEQRGALIGMKTALSNANTEYVALAACDMIFPSPALFRYLYDTIVHTGADIVTPADGYGYEPFHSVYRRTTCLPVIQATLDSGSLQATRWFKEVNVVEVWPSDILSIVPSGKAFINANTPDELHTLEQQIMSGKIPANLNA